MPPITMGPGEPFGEWIDMHGVTWSRHGDGWLRID